MADVTVRLIRAFNGPRHIRLRQIWEAIAEYSAPDVQVRWYHNERGLRHAQCFDAIWQEEQEFDNQVLLLIEEDWLPDLTLSPMDWAGVTSLLTPKNVAAAGLCYCVRSPKSRGIIQRKGTAAGWFIAIDKSLFPGPRHISFEGDPDPGNNLRSQLKQHFGLSMRLIPGSDGYPHHYGVEYAYGTHLFWSRHYHDDPNMRVSGFRLGDIQRRVDWRINQWIAEQPEDFQHLLEERFGSSILGSCSEYIDLRSTFRESFDSYVDWGRQFLESQSGSLPIDLPLK